MARIRDPLSESFVYLIGHRYRVPCRRFSARGSDKADLDPIVNDPVTDSIPVADLPDTKRAIRRWKSRDLVFVA